ncbi:MAG: hypothetical protein ACRDOI_33460 [Trebonia sp.]
MRSKLKMPEAVYFKDGSVVRFNQLAVKIEMDAVDNDQYFAWLDDMTRAVGAFTQGASIAEKAGARERPPLNTAVYYDTPDRALLETGALLRTSCNVVTHAFCAFKMAEDEHGVRNDHRWVFDGDEKRTIQKAPASPAAAAIVRTLMARRDVDHPGTYLERTHGIDPTSLSPSVALDSYRYTFFAWLDGLDALRCSIDRYFVWDMRGPDAYAPGTKVPVSECELAIYPRLSAEISDDPRVVGLIEGLRDSLVERFSVAPTSLIKYQRAARALSIPFTERLGSAIP